MNFEQEKQKKEQEAIKKQEAAINQVVESAEVLLLDEGKSEIEAIQGLVKQGVSPEEAKNAVDNVLGQIRKAKKDKSNSDMTYGALFCIGGTLATVADVGYIFWGAIVFGAIQFFIGAANA